MSNIEKSVAASPYLLCSTQYCESSTCTSDLAVGTESVLISVPVAGQSEKIGIFIESKFIPKQDTIKFGNFAAI